MNFPARTPFRESSYAYVSAPIETTNLLLQRLSFDELGSLSPHFERIDMSRNQRLAQAGKVQDMLYFPEGGITSTMAIDGARTEVGLIGREGLVGIGRILGSDVEMFDTCVQVDGFTALAIPAEIIRDRMDNSIELRRLLSHYLLFHMLQLSYSVVSRSQQMMEARLARWLLMCHDRMPRDDIPVTHEFLAQMISAQRSGVTVTLHLLEGEGLIRSTRGKVAIRDRAKLEALAGCTYGKAEARYRELIGLFGKSEGGGAAGAALA